MAPLSWLLATLVPALARTATVCIDITVTNGQYDDGDLIAKVDKGSGWETVAERFYDKLEDVYSECSTSLQRLQLGHPSSGYGTNVEVAVTVDGTPATLSCDDCTRSDVPYKYVRLSARGSGTYSDDPNAHFWCSYERNNEEPCTFTWRVPATTTMAETLTTTVMATTSTRTTTTVTATTSTRTTMTATTVTVSTTTTMTVTVSTTSSSTSTETASSTSSTTETTTSTSSTSSSSSLTSTRSTTTSSSSSASSTSTSTSSSSRTTSTTSSSSTSTSTGTATSSTTTASATTTTTTTVKLISVDRIETAVEQAARGLVGLMLRRRLANLSLETDLGNLVAFRVGAVEAEGETWSFQGNGGEVLVPKTVLRSLPVDASLSILNMATKKNVTPEEVSEPISDPLDDVAKQQGKKLETSVVDISIWNRAGERVAMKNLDPPLLFKMPGSDGAGTGAFCAYLETTTSSPRWSTEGVWRAAPSELFERGLDPQGAWCFSRHLSLFALLTQALLGCTNLELFSPDGWRAVEENEGWQSSAPAQIVLIVAAALCAIWLLACLWELWCLRLGRTQASAKEVVMCGSFMTLGASLAGV